MGTVPASVPLSTLFRRRSSRTRSSSTTRPSTACPHRTTRRTIRDAGRGGPWLVSFVLWANVLQYVDDDGRHRGGRCGRGPAPTNSSSAACAAGGTHASRRRRASHCGSRPRTTPRCAPAEPAAGTGGLVAAARRHRRSLAAASGPAGRRPAGAGPQGRLRRAPHRSAGLPPGDPSHPERQGRTTPRRRDVADCVQAHPAPSERVPVAAPQRGPARLHGRLRSGGPDLAAHQRQHPARARPARGHAWRPAPADRRVQGGQRHVHRMAGTPRLRRVEPDTTARRGKVIRLTAKGREGAAEVPRLLARHRGVAGAPVRRAPPSTTSGPRSSTSSATGRSPRPPWPPGLVPYPDNWRAAVRRARDAPAPPDGAAPRRLPRRQLRRPGRAPRRMWQA